MKKLVRIISLYGGIYLVMIAIFILFLTLAAALPHTRKFESLVRRSDRIQNKWGLWPEVNGIPLDNVTESCVLNVAYSFDAASPLKSALRSDMYVSKGETHKNLYFLSHGHQEEMIRVDYSRYWLGTAGIMKFLLYFFHIGKIYSFCGIAIMFLSVWALLLLYKQFGQTEFFALFTLLALCNFNVFYQSIQFPPVFFIGLGGLIWFCRHNDLRWRRPVFFILGMLTAYLDMLTAPVLAFGIPALFVCGWDTLREESSGRKDWTTWLRIWFGYPAAWLVGYVLSWGMKILAGGWLCGNLADAFSQMLLRVGNSSPEKQFSRLEAVKRNFEMLFDGSQLFVILLGIIAGIFLVRDLIRLKRKEVFFDIRLSVGYLFLAVMPILVFLLMANHVFIHYWMTYRGLGLTCAALIMIHTAFRPLERHAAGSENGMK